MTSSLLTEEQLTMTKPDEGVMISRETEGIGGFDRSAIRREFAPVEAIDPSERFIEEGDATFLDADSDLPTGPTGLGESMGNVELVRAIGETQRIPRYTHGFTVDDEDREVDASFVADMRDGILELFDIQADYAFLQGLDAEDGSTVFKGVFEWLEDNMPADNIIDCSDYDPSAGDLNGVPANIVKQVAYGKMTGNYVETTWDLAVAKQRIWADWNSMGTFDGAVVQSNWEMMQADADEAGVGVSRRILLPENLEIPTAPSDRDIEFDIDFPARTNSTYTSPLGDASDDAMYLIPQHDGDFYELYEQPTPDVRGPLEKDGFRERFEYKWRGGVVYGQNGHKRDTNVAIDTIKLENPTALFDNA